MIKIEKIAVHKKKKNYFTLQYKRNDGDEGFFDVHEDVLVARALQKDMTLDERLFQEIIQMEKANAIYQTALRYLGIRMRTIKEMETYLIGKGYDHEQIKAAIERLKAENLLNDREFAGAFVRSRMRVTDKGPAYIFQELRQKGVEGAIAHAALEVFTDDDQYHHAKKFADKKVRTMRGESHAEKKRKLAGALAQKGFNREIITSVLESLADRDSDEEWEAIVRQGAKAEAKFSKWDEPERLQKIRQFLFRKGFSNAMIDRYIDQRDDLNLS